MNILPSFPLSRWLAAAVLLTAASSATAQLDDLLNCQKIADPSARLACFDREVPRLATQPNQPVAARAQSATPAAAPAVPEARFGLRAQPENQGTSRIVSTLPDGFSGWRAGQRIQLGNGQVWRIADDSAAFVDLKSPRVVVRQGALGAFYLDFDGDRRSPRVRRVE